MIYAPHQVYSNPECAFHEYKKQVIIIFHGFLSAMPNAFFKTLNQAFGSTFTVVGYNYDYFDIEQNENAFDHFFQNALKNRILYFAGTSLGGFWAQHLADIHQGQHVILSNPVIHPSQVLARFKGKDNYSERRKQAVTVTREKLNRYHRICLKKNFTGNRLVLLTENDDIQDPAIAQNFFKGVERTRVMTFRHGGHTIDFNTHTRARAALESFIKKSAGRS